MAKARLLRQYLTDYNREVKGANKDYKEQYATYKTAAEAYNQKITKFNSDAQGMTPGDIYQNEQGTLTQFDKKGNPVAYSSPQLGWGYPDESGATTTTTAPYKGADGLWYQDVMQTTAGTEASYDEYGQPIPAKPGTTTKVDTVYIPVKAFHPGTAPTAPAQEVPKAPTFTVNQLEEMANPSNSAAEINRAQAFGYSGKSALVAERDPTKNSAFANLGGDDPNNLKEKGVLARAIAGEI